MIFKTRENQRFSVSKKFSRKSQAAMEFLMTYGWAILVVLAAIAALAYFGVLSPEKFLPERCLIATGLTCISSKVESSQSTIVFSNNLGKSLTIDSVQIGDCTTAFSYSMQSEDESTFVVDPAGCNYGDVKESFKGDITIKYTEKRTNLSKTVYGQLNTKIE